MLRPDRGHHLVDRGRVAGEVLGPQGLQVGKAEHPLAVGQPVEDDHPDDVGQVVTLGAQLGDLGLVLGEDDPGAAVGEDEGDIFGPGRGIDGGRRGARAHDRDVLIQPLDAGGGDDRDPLLGLDPEGKQAGCHRLDGLGSLPPGQRCPAGPGREAKRLGPGGRRDPVIEHPGHRHGRRRVAAGLRAAGGRRGHDTSTPPATVSDRPLGRLTRSLPRNVGAHRCTSTAEQPSPCPTVSSWARVVDQR
jgi:hypothetical protein